MLAILLVGEIAMAGLEGQTLDRYELEQLTGRGGMADVYRTFDPQMLPYISDLPTPVFARSAPTAFLSKSTVEAM